MRIFMTEIRRSPLRWWLPVLLAVDLLAIFGRSRYWMGEWPQTSVQAQIPAFYFGPAAAAASAWASGRSRRRGADDLLLGAARAIWLPNLVQLASTLCYVVGVYLAGCLAAATASELGVHGSGFLWPSYIALGLALVVSFAAIGHAIGRIVSAPYGGSAIAGLLCLACVTWLGDQNALGLFTTSGAPFLRVGTLPLLARFACVVVIMGAGGLALHYSHTHRAARSFRPGGVFLAAMLPVLGLLLAAGPVQGVRNPAQARQVCTKTVPKICFWSEDSKYLGAATAMADRAAALPAPFVSPPLFTEQGLTREKMSVTSFYVLEGSLWDPAESMAGAILSHTRPPDCTPSSTLPEPAMVASGNVTMWLAMRIYGGARPAGMHGEPPGVDMAAVEKVLGLPAERQDAWALSQWAVVRDALC
ncbi:hypothetical protein ABZ726_21990 [Streptomyces hundungensis]|uniref:hypothetical protein n=1 Tax=Streptomyces hundungensis TaxID=1077946 RepID=UPI0033F72656